MKAFTVALFFALGCGGSHSPADSGSRQDGSATADASLVDAGAVDASPVASKDGASAVDDSGLPPVSDAGTCAVDEVPYAGKCYPTTRACTSGGIGTQTFANGAYGACTFTMCDPVYSLSAGACVLTSESCTVSNGQGVKTFNAGAYGACQVKSCNAGYSIVGNACSAAPTFTTTTFDSAMTISSPGSYSLTADITPTTTANSFTPIINIENTSNVTLDCNGHKITGPGNWFPLQVSNVQNFTVTNCSFQQNSGSGESINIVSSVNGTISNSTIGGTDSGNTSSGDFMNVQGTSALKLTNNHVFLSIQIYNSFYSVISGNTFVNNLANNTVGRVMPAPLILSNGAYNSATNNSLEGNCMTANCMGTDDGFTISDEDDDVLTGNTIKDFAGCAIEFVGNISNLTVSNNTISGINYSAIGGFYNISFMSTMFANNTAASSGTLFNFNRVDGLRPPNSAISFPGDNGVYFKNNVFANNTLSSTSATTGSGAQIQVFNYMDYGFGFPGNGATDPTKAQFHISNNTFTGNDFGKFSSMWSAPDFGGTTGIAGYIIDGGNNVCDGGPVPATGYPLVCK